jgi:membrane protein required for colicin V production
LSKVDIVIAIILLLGAISGYRKGFLMELFFLLALVLGVFLGFRLMGKGMEYLAKEFNADTAVLPYITFALIFVLVLVLVTLIGKMIKGSVDQTFLGKIDSAAGALLGIVKNAFGISVIIWLIEVFNVAPPDSWKNDSVLYPVAAQVAPTLSEYFGEFLPFFKETFKQF